MRNLIFFFSLFMIGCASFNSGKNPIVSDADMTSIKTDTIAFELEPVAQLSKDNETYTYKIDSRLQSYGLLDVAKPELHFICANGTCSGKTPDLHIYAEYSSSSKPPPNLGLRTLLFILTLGLIPAYETYDIQLNAVAVDSKNKIIGHYQYQDSVETHYQIFLPLIYPFIKTNSAEDTFSNLARLVATQADKDFQRKNPTKQVASKP